MLKTKNLFKTSLVLLVMVSLISCDQESDSPIDTEATKMESIVINDNVYNYEMKRDDVLSDYYVVESEETGFIRSFFTKNMDYATYVNLDTEEVTYYSNFETMSKAKKELNDTSSKSGALIKLYEHKDYGGASITLDAARSYLNFDDLNFNDRASSIVLYKTTSHNMLSASFKEYAYANKGEWGRSLVLATSKDTPVGASDLSKWTRTSFLGIRTSNWNDRISACSSYTHGKPEN